MRNSPDSNRSSFIVMAIALTACFLFSILVVNGIKKWTNIAPGKAVTSRGKASEPQTGRSGGFSGHRDESDQSDEPMDVAPASPKPELTDAQLLELMKQKLQGVGAMENEAILKFSDQAALDAFLKRAKAAGFEVVRRVGDSLNLNIRYGSMDALMKDLKEHPDDYDNLSANYFMRIPTDPVPDPANQGGAAPYSDNSHLDSIGAVGSPADRATWGQGVTVAVLDTGLTAHPTFGTGQIVAHVDLVNDGQAFHGHGNGMASLIAGQHEQAPGVAPGVKLLDYRVADGQGRSDTATMADAIDQAVKAGAKVISISMAGYGDAPVLQQSVAAAQAKGVIIVAAAGNEQASSLALPAAYPGVISVGAVDRNNQQAYFSNSGEGLKVSAPGVGIPSAWTESNLVQGDGTSQAAALVSGTVATYLATGRTAEQATRQMFSQLQPIPGGNPAQVGQGVVKVAR